MLHDGVRNIALYEISTSVSRWKFCVRYGALRGVRGCWEAERRPPRTQTERVRRRPRLNGRCPPDMRNEVEGTGPDKAGQGRRRRRLSRACRAQVQVGKRADRREKAGALYDVSRDI
ncbi:hypothetical protein FGB62_139g141 [Gracilaria domingensis]|nr:hypothetical protein FGB62_139g141 [Gracilaria domingensis]